MEFKKILKLFREQRGLNKTEAANKIGITPPYYMQLESGSRNPPNLDRIRQIAAALRLSKEESDRLVHAAAVERLPKEEVGEIEGSIANQALRDHVGAGASWTSIRGSAKCPHCKKQIELEVNQAGDFFVSGKVTSKIKQY